MRTYHHRLTWDRVNGLNGGKPAVGVGVKKKETGYHVSLPEQVWHSRAKSRSHAEVAENSVSVKQEHLLSICRFQRNSRETWRGSRASRAATCYCQRATITAHAWAHTSTKEKQPYPTFCLNYQCTVTRYCYCSSDWDSGSLAKHICNDSGVNYTVQMGVRWRWQGRWARRYWIEQERVKDMEDVKKVLCRSKSTGCPRRIGGVVKRCKTCVWPTLYMQTGILK